MKAEMIGPCGMNCSICLAHLRKERRCPGCWKKSLRCMIKNCPEWKKHEYRFCYHCPNFPCSRIKHLDDRYTTRYDMSMIENLGFIKKHGIARFLKNEKKKWVTPEGVLCCHDKKIYKEV